MVNLDNESTKTDALDVLREASGQSYVLSGEAIKILHPFDSDVTKEFVVEQTVLGPEDVSDEPTDEAGALALSAALEDKQRSAKQARGITSVAPHKMLLTYSDVSASIVEALGGESSDHTAGGYGYTADGRHDENVSTLEEQLDV